MSEAIDGDQIDGDQNEWLRLLRDKPGHSEWYIERFRTMAAEGEDLDGEARLVDAMVARGARILDAGCGPGRVGGALARRGHEVVGVDIDAALIDAAEQDHPGPLWLVGDLAELDLPAQGITDGFDVIVCAGNVMTFLAPNTRATVLERLHAHLAPEGRLVVGFGLDRGYPLAELRRDVDEVGLVVDLLLSTWDLRPWHEGDGFVVAVLDSAGPAGPADGISPASRS